MLSLSPEFRQCHCDINGKVTHILVHNFQHIYSEKHALKGA